MQTDISHYTSIYVCVVFERLAYIFYMPGVMPSQLNVRDKYADDYTWILSNELSIWEEQ